MKGEKCGKIRRNWGKIGENKGTERRSQEVGKVEGTGKEEIRGRSIQYK